MQVDYDQLFDKLDKLQKVEPDAVQAHISNCRIFDFLLNHDTVDPSDMEQFTYDDLDWAFNALIDMPTVEVEAYYCFGQPLFEYFRAKDLIESISHTKRQRNKTFF